MSDINYLEYLIDKIKEIDTTDVSDVVDDTVLSTVVEEQKVYFWIRLYIKDENSNIQIGDDITIKWLPSGEFLDTKFIAGGKKGLERDHDNEMVNYNSEDDKRILCLMIDTKMVNNNDDIPFIRTLFETGNHYEYQLVRRVDLTFSNKRNNEILEYYDVHF
jgi:hypothetical protein